MENKRYLLIDESGIFIRQAMGIPGELCTTSGFCTNGVFGFTRSVLDVILKVKPHYVISCGDSSRANLERRKIYPYYKKNRDDAKPLEIKDYKWQKECVYSFLKHMEIQRLIIDGQEADDIIASLATQLGEKGDEVFIYSGDKDMVQLINDKVTVILPKHSSKIKKEAEALNVDYDQIEKYDFVKDLDSATNVLGVHPSRGILAQALIGDTADNYAGAIGIGKGGANKLAAEFDSIEAIYEGIKAGNPLFFTKKGAPNKLHKDLIRALTPEEIEKWGYSQMGITTNKESIKLSYELAELRTDLDMQINCKPLYEYDKEAMVEFLEELEFDSLMYFFK